MPSIPNEVRLLPVRVPRAIRPEDVENAASGTFIAELIRQSGVTLQNGDVVAVSSKVASFLDGGLVRLDDVVPTRKARLLGRLFGREPRKIQLVLEQGKVLVVVPMKRIIDIPELRAMLERRTDNPAAMAEGYRKNNAFTFIVRKHAVYLDEAGIDHTNSPDEYVSLLPEDPCRLAGEIRDGLRRELGVDVAVILTDTTTSIGRLGSQDIAIGYAGIDPVTRLTFTPDLFGIRRSGGIDLVIDSIAGMAGLVMGQTIEKTPIVVIRGVSYEPERPDELPGMAAVSWPESAQWKFVLFSVLATMRFKLVSLLAFQRRTKRSRRPGA